MSKKSPSGIISMSTVIPRLLRLTDAANYLSCTFGFMETLIRERTLPVVILGKRHLLDVRDLDDYIDQVKSEGHESLFQVVK